MKVTFHTGVGTVTGANFMLDIAGKKVLVDCGMVQGSREDEMQNHEPWGYEPSEMDILFITHAHLDHVGRIPKLVKDGFRGPIYSTPETIKIAELILTDAVGLLDRGAREQGILALYESRDVEDTMRLWKAIPYHTETSIEGFSVYLKDAGHILGSAMIQFKVNEDGVEKNIIFTGDLGNTPAPLLRDTESVEGAQYLVMESVYGDRNHDPKETRSAQLEKIVNDTIERGGTLVIPAFSVERTQVILYELNELVESGRVKSVPVFLDSPLAISVTDIYKSSKSLFNAKAQGKIDAGDDIFRFPRLQFTVSRDESHAIDHTKSPKIILAGSGMSMGGRVTHHEALYLPDPKSTILLVGYQPVGTLGRKLLDGEKKIDINGQHIKVKAKLESILGYSAHKDSDHLVEFVSTAGQSLKKVFVVMGEPKASAFLAQRLNHDLGANAVCPDARKEYEL